MWFKNLFIAIFVIVISFTEIKGRSIETVNIYNKNNGDVEIVIKDGIITYHVDKYKYTTNNTKNNENATIDLKKVENTATTEKNNEVKTTMENDKNSTATTKNNDEVITSTENYKTTTDDNSILLPNGKVKPGYYTLGKNDPFPEYFIPCAQLQFDNLIELECF